MIAISSHGRLGNQMFQYAFAYSKAPYGLFVWDEIDELRIYDYFKLDWISRALRWSWMRKFWRKIVKDQFTVIDHSLDDSHRNAEIARTCVKPLCLYRGFFQSDLYFIDMEVVIKKRFQIKKHLHKALAEKLHDYINREYAVIHVRLGDYKNFQIYSSPALLPKEYYLKGFATLRSKCERILVVSDEIEEAKSLFGPDVEYILGSSELEDFYLLMNANFLLISNSSFSWWAAYLNTKKAVVYAPKYWLGYNARREYPVNIMTSNFVWLD